MGLQDFYTCLRLRSRLLFRIYLESHLARYFLLCPSIQGLRSDAYGAIDIAADRCAIRATESTFRCCWLCTEREFISNDVSSPQNLLFFQIVQINRLMLFWGVYGFFNLSALFENQLEQRWLCRMVFLLGWACWCVRYIRKKRTWQGAKWGRRPGYWHLLKRRRFLWAVWENEVE